MIDISIDRILAWIVVLIKCIIMARWIDNRSELNV